MVRLKYPPRFLVKSVSPSSRVFRIFAWFAKKNPLGLGANADLFWARPPDRECIGSADDGVRCALLPDADSGNENRAGRPRTGRFSLDACLPARAVCGELRFHFLFELSSTRPKPRVRVTRDEGRKRQQTVLPQNRQPWEKRLSPRITVRIARRTRHEARGEWMLIQAIPG